MLGELRSARVPPLLQSAGIRPKYGRRRLILQRAAQALRGGDAMSRAIGIVSVTLISSAAFGQASFQGLGDLPGGAFSSHAHDVSNDGNVVVGWSNSESGGEAFRWSASDGMLGLGDLTGGLFQSDALGVSAQGDVIVGSGETEFGSHPFRWTPATGLQPLGTPPQERGAAYGITPDGLTIVGELPRAVRWDGPSLVQTHLSPNGYAAFGVSSDGRVAVGYGVADAMFQPIRWIGTSAEGLGGNRGEAHAASFDGEVVVGWTYFDVSQSAEQAFRWSAPGMVRLTEPNGEWTESRAFDVSADGSIIVGWGKSRSRSGERAIIWDAANGMRLLKAVLEHDFCLDLTGWNHLPRAAAISDDGLVIVGNGVVDGGNSQAWIARITLLAATDRDHDGTPNCADGCPDDAAKIEPGVCGCNVPDVDTDKDNVLDCLDGCPNDPNKTEPGVCGCNAPDVDSDVDGLLDCLDNCPNHYNPDQADCNGDGVGDVCAITSGMSRDCNTNGMPDDCEIAAIHDCCDTLHGPRCSNAAIAACVCGLDPYCCEQEWDRVCVARVIDETCGRCNTVSDCDGNSIPDACEPDCNTNGVTDACDILDGTSVDCQPNGIPDECDPDFDLDGTTDDCDVDIDDDGILNENDVCDFTPLGSPVDAVGRQLGDINGNCALDLEDYATLSVCLSISGPGDPPPLTECLDVFNVDDDADVDIRDVASFQRFFGQ